jgi:hypothetical protein
VTALGLRARGQGVNWATSHLLKRDKDKTKLIQALILSIPKKTPKPQIVFAAGCLCGTFHQNIFGL